MSVWACICDCSSKLFFQSGNSEVYLSIVLYHSCGQYTWNLNASWTPSSLVSEFFCLILSDIRLMSLWICHLEWWMVSEVGGQGNMIWQDKSKKRISQLSRRGRNRHETIRERSKQTEKNGSSDTLLCFCALIINIRTTNKIWIFVLVWIEQMPLKSELDFTRQNNLNRICCPLNLNNWMKIKEQL